MYGAPRDYIEEHVSRLASKLLRRSGIEMTDNLFDHGMDSLQITELRLLLRKQCGAMPSLDDVYLNPTIRGLAKILRDKTARCMSIDLIEIQAKGDRPALFLVNPGSRSPLYEPLARHLHPRQPVYELALSAIDDYRLLPYIDVEAIGERYLHAIRSRQAFGPYLIGGYRGGGLLALEVANQLRKEGHEVPLVMMFGHLPRRLLGRSQARLAPSRLALGQVSDQLFTALVGLLRRRAAYPWLDAFRRGSENRVAQRAIRGAISRCVPTPYPGRIAWFVESEDRRGQDRNSWKAGVAVAGAPVEVCHVSSRESQMLTRAHVGRLARPLAACLAKVQGLENSEAPS
jgi:thioesterase domain-containing protein/aryl carrier-like protein